jgi:nucleoside-diphosphate-sugar epimerase
MRVVVLGCGVVGQAAANLLTERGHTVVGVRRTATPSLIAGDAADPALWSRLPRPDAVLITATPGLRRGRDHGLQRAAQLIPAGARVVYSGTTAVYGGADGEAVAEDGPLLPEAAPLLAVEQAVLAHGDALVLRCPALIGPSRLRVQERARAAAANAQPLTVPGDPDRPFSVLHEDDLAWLLTEAVDGRLRDCTGVLNAAHPHATTVRAYYGAQAACAGVSVTIISDGSHKPSRAIAADRLHALLPDHAWQR